MATLGLNTASSMTGGQPGAELLEKLCETLLRVVINNNNDEFQGTKTDCIRKDAEEILAEIVKQEIARNTKELQGCITSLHKELEEKEDLLQRSNSTHHTTEITQKINDDEGSQVQETSDDGSAGNTTEKVSNDGNMSHPMEQAKISHLEQELRKSESARESLKESLQKSEDEREEEMRIVQEALEEAAQERESLIGAFQKELERVNLMKSTDEQQMIEDFEWKLSELKKEHKDKMQEKENQLQEALEKKKLSEGEEYLRKVEKLREELTFEWDEKSRAEISQLRSELIKKHSKEQSDALSSLEQKKNKEMDELRDSLCIRLQDLEKEVISLKTQSKIQIADHAQEVDEIRTASDRDLCQLRMKMQKIDDTAYEKQLSLIEEHKMEIDRVHVSYRDEISLLQSRIHSLEQNSDIKEKLQEQHLEEINRYELQNRINMERLIEEHEQEKVSAVQELKEYLEKSHEEAMLKLQAEIEALNLQFQQQKQCTEELTMTLSDRNKTLKKLEEDICKIRTPSRNISQASSTSGICTGDFSVSRNSSQSSIASEDSFESSEDEIETEHECEE